MKATLSAPFAIAIAMLALASILDLRERRVRNAVWFPFIAAAIPIQIVAAAEHGWWPIAAAAAATVTAYGLWYVGLMFGGADAKGLMVLAWLVPAYGIAGAPDATAKQLLPVLDLFVNALLLTLVYPVAIFVANAARGRFHPAMFLGTPMSLANAEARHVLPLQRIDAAGRLRFRILPRRDETISGLLAAYRDGGHDVVWTTPKIPFMVPLLGGTIVAALYGNLLVAAMQAWLLAP